jgi:hypothetical protein
MKRRFAILMSGCLCMAAVWAGAADEPKEAPLPPEPAKAREVREKKLEESQKLRQELKGLSPEQRQARLRELREKQTIPREELEKRRKELRKLPPAERAAKLKELREKIGEHPKFKAMPPDQRKAKREELKGRFDKQLDELRKKKAAGSLTLTETKRLQRIEGMAQRFKQARETNSPPSTP